MADVTDLTSYPIGTSALAPLSRNASDVDKLVNGTGTVENRAGGTLKTWAQLEADFEADTVDDLQRYSALNNTGAWVTATDYEPNDLWSYDGNWYIVLTAYTSGATAPDDIAGGNVQIYPVSGIVWQATSLTQMKSMTPLAEGQVIQLSAGGRSGTFEYLVGDYSAEVAADTLEGVYVALDSDSDGSEGVLKRVLNGVSTYNVEWFGAINTDSDTVVSAVSCILNLITKAEATAGFTSNTSNGGDIFFPKRDEPWKHYADLTIKADNTYIIGSGMRSSALDMGDYELKIGESNVDPTHGFYDPVCGPSYCGIKNIEIKSSRSNPLGRSTILDTAHVFELEDVFFNNQGHQASIGLELITAQWVKMKRVYWSRYGGGASLYLNAAGAGHGHVHLDETCKFLDSSNTVRHSDAFGAHIVVHRYKGDGSEGTPTNLGGSFFGKWEETTINGHFHATSDDKFTEFAGIKTRSYTWPNALGEADVLPLSESLAVASIGMVWFEGCHTMLDLNGSDRICITAVQSLTNGRTVRGIVNGEGVDSSITFISGDINGLLADGRYEFSEISGGAISQGDYFKDALGNVSLVTRANDESNATDAYCANPQPQGDQIDFSMSGASVTFYSDEAGTIPTGVTATATKTEHCALISTNSHLMLGNVGIDGDFVNRNNILDIARLDYDRTHCTQKVYGDDTMYLSFSVSNALSATNNDYNYPNQYPQGLRPSRESLILTPEGDLSSVPSYFVDSFNDDRVRIKTSGGTSSNNLRVSSRMFD